MNAQSIAAPAFFGRACGMLCVLLAFLVGIGTAGAQERPVPTEEDLAAFGEAVASVYQWKQQYEQTVEGLIEASRRMPGVWSGTDNADTEEERVGLVRGILSEQRDAVLLDARNRLVAAADPYDVLDHLERMIAGQITPADATMRDTVHTAYRDAIFDAIVTSSVKAQGEIEGRQ